MAKKIQFKNSDSVMVIPGVGKVTNENLTREIYERLLLANKEAYEPMFEEREVDDAPLFISVKKETPAEAVEIKSKSNKSKNEQSNP